MPNANWQQAEAEILQSLDLQAEYASLGIEFAGGEPSAEGWLACRAIGREDRHPSAAVNVRTGRYKDAGGSGLSLSLWDFAAQFGPFSAWQDARKHFADKVGAKLPRGRPPVDPAQHLQFQPWNHALVARWCLEKPGVTPEAVQAFGGRLARYREQYTCVALPIFGPGSVEVDPVGWVLCQTNGKPLPVFQRAGPTRYVKYKTTAGSDSGLIGLATLRRLTGNEGPPAAGALIWKTEGPLDALAVWSAMPAEIRNRHLVITTAGGATEHPKPWMGGIFAGWPVAVIPDADEPGQAGGQQWAEWFASVAGASKIVKLPYPVAPYHGKDVRDWLSEENTYAELIELAKASPIVEPPADQPTTLRIIEADDDPHRLARLYREKYCTHDGLQTLAYWRDEWCQWDGRRYRHTSDTILRGRLNRAIKQEFDTLNLAEQESPQDGQEPPECRKVTITVVANVRAALAAEVAVDAEIEEQGWLEPTDRSGACIALQNGILDIDALLAGRDDCLIPHTPLWFSPICLPFPFDPEADCQLWKRILAENLEGDADRLALLQEWSGYCLVPDTSEQKFLFCEGEGANGKSVYFAAIEAMLGEENVSHVGLEKFGDRFALSSTIGKLANIVAEVGELDKAAEAQLKQFTGGDRMTFDRKGISSVEVTPTARLMLAANNRPRFVDRSAALWRRMFVVPFRVEVPTEKRIKGMDKPKWWRASGELPGIFNWALAGLHQLRTQSGFTMPKLCADALEDYRMESNPAQSFLEETCEAAEHGSIFCHELYAHYKKWCGTNGYRPLGERQFGKEVRRKFPAATKRQTRFNGNRVRIHDGIFFSEGSEEHNQQNF